MNEFDAIAGMVMPSQRRPNAKIDVVAGMKYGRLTLIREASRSSSGRMVVCRCECGAVGIFIFKSIRTGNTSSCGCLRREMVARKNFRHGSAPRRENGERIPEYVIWKGMRQRCCIDNREHADRYALRGIFICERWNNFENFLKDMGRRPSDSHQIDRIDNDGPYSPENCRWVTPKEQQRNKRSNTVLVFNGTSATIAEWSEILEIPYSRIMSRIVRDKTIDEILYPGNLGNRKVK